MFSHSTTLSSYSEKFKIFHICREQSLWDQTDPTSCITFDEKLEFSVPGLLSLVKSNDRCIPQAVVEMKC